MAKKNLTLNWNTLKRNNLEYSELPRENLRELNSRKYNYSLKIFKEKPCKLVVWDRNIKQSYGMVNGSWGAYPSQNVFEAESNNIDELMEMAQNFINEQFNE